MSWRSARDCATREMAFRLTPKSRGLSHRMCRESWRPRAAGHDVSAFSMGLRSRSALALSCNRALPEKALLGTFARRATACRDRQAEPDSTDAVDPGGSSGLLPAR